MQKEIIDPIDFLLNLVSISDRVKIELRHGWSSSGRWGSVSAHSWSLWVMIIFATDFFAL